MESKSMKKILVVLVALVLSGCQSKPMTLKESYGKYKQESIVYVNKNDYLNKKEAYNKYLIYEINKKAFTFESDLVYQDVVYKKRELTKDEEKRMPEALVSYDLYIGDKKLGIGIFLGEETVYISSYDQYDDQPVYIAKIKKIIKKS